MTTKLEVVEDVKMRWPDGWDRTRIQDRKANAQWKNPYGKYRDSLVRELELMGATALLISRGNLQQDPGVAVWFSLKKEDFSWQDSLGIDNPAPTLDEIDNAFKIRAMKHHPDRGGDIEIFKRLGEAKKQARAWVLGANADRHEYVMALDRYKEARLNLAGLRLAFANFRSLQRLGMPTILERVLDKAFKTALPMEAGK